MHIYAQFWSCYNHNSLYTWTWGNGMSDRYALYNNHRHKRLMHRMNRIREVRRLWITLVWSFRGNTEPIVSCESSHPTPTNYQLASWIELAVSSSSTSHWGCLANIYRGRYPSWDSSLYVVLPDDHKVYRVATIPLIWQTQDRSATCATWPVLWYPGWWNFR